MTRSLGDLGTPHELVDLTFDYFGVVIRVNPLASDLDLVGFMIEAAEVDELDENKAVQAVARYLKGLVHVEDWDTFWRQAKANRQAMPDLMLLGETIVEAVSGVPTSPPAASSGGRQNTNSKSKGGSSSRRTPRRGASSADDTRRALEVVPEGRDDIKEFLVMAQENRAAAANMTVADRMNLSG